MTLIAHYPTAPLPGKPLAVSTGTAKRDNLHFLLPLHPLPYSPYRPLRPHIPNHLPHLPRKLILVPPQRPDDVAPHLELGGVSGVCGNGVERVQEGVAGG